MSDLPFIPVARPAMDRSDAAAVATVFESRWLGLGEVTAEFEEALGGFVGRALVLATNTGTSAVELALRAAGIGPGDDVIVPALTFVATGQAVQAVGANVVVCDVEPDTLNVSAKTLSEACTRRTRAVIPVHYRGVPVDIDAIVTWAKETGIRVIEDAAHAFGSFYDDGTPVGGKGDICCFSFDPIKNITCGEGGAIVFPSEAEHAAAARMRVLGIDSSAWSRLEARRPWQYDVTSVGFRFHMPNFCAAVGLSQIKRLDQFRAAKTAALDRYQDAIAELEWIEARPVNTERVLPFLAVALTEHRERLMQHLRDLQIGSGVQYQPMNSFSHFAHGRRVPTPATDALAKTIISLPLLNDQSQEETERVVTALMTFDAD